MKIDQKGFSFVLVLIVLVAIFLLGGIGWTVWHQNKATSKSHGQTKVQSSHNTVQLKLITKTYCSDVCPQQTQTYKVFEGINDQEQCSQVNGRVIKDSAWGGYIGCGPK